MDKLIRFNEKYNFNIHHVEIIKRAIKAATQGHNDTNHKYGDVSYTIHLSHVVDVAYRFIHLVPMHMRPLVIAACWLHDSIEDARLSYNDILKIFKGLSPEIGVQIAEIVRAVTNNGRGRNRDERMSPEVYNDIRNVEGARFVKFCDRIGNIEYGGKAKMYSEEQEKFSGELFDSHYILMFDYMQILFTEALYNSDIKRQLS
jgi:(p)ppGpp synthase/HD superfamily hydrolase